MSNVNDKWAAKRMSLKGKLLELQPQILRALEAQGYQVGLVNPSSLDQGLSYTIQCKKQDAVIYVELSAEHVTGYSSGDPWTGNLRIKVQSGTCAVKDKTWRIGKTGLKLVATCQRVDEIWQAVLDNNKRSAERQERNAQRKQVIRDIYDRQRIEHHRYILKDATISYKLEVELTPEQAENVISYMRDLGYIS